MKMHPKYLSITFTSNSSVKYDMYSRSAGHSPSVHFLICMLDNPLQSVVPLSQGWVSKNLQKYHNQYT